MEEKVLNEIKKIRGLLSEFIGTSDKPSKEKFSKEAIKKAAKDYRNMSIQRGDWITRDDIHKVIKKANWNTGKFIIEQFGFSNYFRKGNVLYFNKKDLIALNKELIKRNINIEEYSYLLEDQAKFEKYLQSIYKDDGKKHSKKYIIPERLRDLNSKHYPPPSRDIINEEITNLMGDFTKFDLSEYISFYDKKTYAYFKYDYTFDRYLDARLKKFCKDWCFKFNYANDALKKISEIEKGNDRQF